MSKKTLAIILLLILAGTVGYILFSKIVGRDNGKSDIVGPLSDNTCKEKALSLTTFTKDNPPPMSLRYDIVACGDKAVPYLSELLNRNDLSTGYALGLLSAIATNASIDAIVEKFGDSDKSLIIDNVGNAFLEIKRGTPAQSLINCLVQATSLATKCQETLIRLSDAEVTSELVRKIREIYPSGTMPVPSSVVIALKPYTMILAQLKPSDAVNGVLQANNDYQLIQGVRKLQPPNSPGTAVNTQQECESRHGMWRYISNRCVLPASDAGKECRNGTECQAACVADLTPEEEALLSKGPGKHTLNKSGRCSEFVFGCFARVDNGQVDGILCAD